MAFQKIAATSELAPGSSKMVTVEGREIALFHVDGKFFAIENSCAHRGGPLAEGAIEGCIVTCPWHGYKFDVASGKSISHPLSSVGCFTVKVEGQDIWVEV